MTSAPPRRRFVPEVVETTARTSKRPNRGDPETQLSDRISDQKSSPSHTPASLPPGQMKASPVTRHFFPQPIETPSRGSRGLSEVEEDAFIQEEDQHVKDSSIGAITGEGSTASKNKPHRFLPQPVEITTKSSKKFAVEPVETGSKKSGRRKVDQQNEEKLQSTRRRFAPEPVETFINGHHKKQAEADEQSGALRTRRRFVLEPVETTAKSTRGKQVEAKGGSQSQPTRRKFAPEFIESTVRRRKKPSLEEEPDLSSYDEKSSRQSSGGIGSPRKFSPELIETARGSFRRGDASPRLSRSGTTDHPTAVPRYLRPPLAPRNTPSPSSEEVPQIHESRFSAASLARKQTRQHSFIVPELPRIESDSSEENSAVPSLSTSSSASSDESTNRPRKGEGGENQDGSFQGYMLSLAAQAAEKQLRDQAMAAYPNEQVHEPVQHFAVEDSDEESMSGKLQADDGIDPKIFRRESGADLDWHMKEMRRHHALLEDAKRTLKEDTAGQSRFSTAALSARHHAHAQKEVGGLQKGVGLAQMRNAASPPMLGDDLVFPKSLSPKMTRCDVDQIPVPRTHEDNASEDDTGEPKLWCANIGVQNNPEAGLWMGFCQKRDCDAESPPAPMRSGLMTPVGGLSFPEGALELRHGRGCDQPIPNLLHRPPTPCSPQNDPFTQSIDNKLNKELSIEQQIEEEFHHSFITQIYNYLSLGYPSLAHKFDYELSKISRIPVEELRKDDDLADAKGYVGAPEGEGLDEDSAKEGKCTRWTALRLYIHEWARQQPGMADRTPNEWGVRARRGSWAF